MSSKKYSRYFSGVTYLSHNQLKDIFEDHISSIRSYAFILHDRDSSVSHTHFVVRLYSSWSIEQVKRWFDNITDEQGVLVNTLLEVVTDVTGIMNYLLHTKELDKFQYDVTDLVSYNVEDMVDLRNSCDNSFDILTDYMNEVPLMDMVRRYGRDFLYHYNAYKTIAEDIIKNLVN